MGCQAVLSPAAPLEARGLALGSAFSREPYPAWVEAGPHGSAFVIVRNPLFRRLFDAEPAFREFLFGVLSGRVFELMCTLEEAGTAHVAQRVARLLLRRRDPAGLVQASQAAIASDLGTAREVVFRALRSLADQRLVATGRSRIRILDAEGLQRVARP